METAPILEEAYSARLLADRTMLSGLVGLRIRSGIRSLYRALPHNSFALTVHCDDEWENSPIRAVKSRPVALSPIGVAAVDFFSSGSGVVVIAFLTPIGATRLLRGRFETDAIRHADASAFLGRSVSNALVEAARSGNLLSDKVTNVGAWLTERLNGAAMLEPGALRAAQAAVYLSADLSLDVTGAAKFVQIGRRQLEYDFQHWLGISPARYAAVTRLERVLRAIPGPGSLASIAAVARYADQAHMTRSIQSATGLTPATIRRLAAAPASLAIRNALGGRVAAIRSQPGE